MYTLSICLSDIPEDKITVSQKNGKLYADIELGDRKDGPDQYGNDAWVRVRRSKEERQANAPHKYCGNAKKVDFGDDNRQTVAAGQHPFAARPAQGAGVPQYDYGAAAQPAQGSGMGLQQNASGGYSAVQTGGQAAGTADGRHPDDLPF